MGGVGEIRIPGRVGPALRVALACAYVAGVSLALYAWFAAWHYDDPFITYRYAENLAQGQGFAYNPGERVQSTTTPLFALLLALCAALGVEIPVAANALGCLSLALGGLCLWDLCRRAALPWVAWSGLLLYPTSLLLQMTIGSETPLYIALCLGAFAAFARERYAACAACCGLALVARADGVLVAAVIAAAFAARWRAQTWRRMPWRAVALFAGIALAWGITAWLYFGTPIPVTLAAKRAQRLMGISQGFAPGLWHTVVLRYGELAQHRLEAALALLGLPLLVGRGRPLGPLVVWTGLYFLAYSLLGVTSYYWYYAPLVPGFLALAGLGVTALADGARWLAQRVAPARARPAGLALAGVVLCALALLQVRQIPVTLSRGDPRYRIYRAAGEWLRANVPADARVGALEVGVIGYFARRPMVDFAGLLQPDVAGVMRRETTYEDTALYAVERYQPEWVVQLEGQLPRFAEHVQAHCQLRARLPARRFRYRYDLLIHECPR